MINRIQDEINLDIPYLPRDVVCPTCGVGKARSCIGLDNTNKAKRGIEWFHKSRVAITDKKIEREACVFRWA